MLNWMSGQGWAHGTVLAWHAQGNLEFEPQYLEVKVLTAYNFFRSTSEGSRIHKNSGAD